MESTTPPVAMESTTPPVAMESTTPPVAPSTSKVSLLAPGFLGSFWRNCGECITDKVDLSCRIIKSSSRIITNFDFEYRLHVSLVGKSVSIYKDIKNLVHAINDENNIGEKYYLNVIKSIGMLSYDIFSFVGKIYFSKVEKTVKSTKEIIFAIYEGATEAWKGNFFIVIVKISDVAKSSLYLIVTYIDPTGYVACEAISKITNLALNAIEMYRKDRLIESGENAINFAIKIVQYLVIEKEDDIGIDDFIR